MDAGFVNMEAKFDALRAENFITRAPLEFTLARPRLGHSGLFEAVLRGLNPRARRQATSQARRRQRPRNKCRTECRPLTQGRRSAASARRIAASIAPSFAYCRA